MDPYGIAIAVCSAISLVILIPPLIFHIRKRNIPTICLLTFLLLEAFNSVVCACIWSDENFYKKWDGKGYCDVFQKIKAGSSSGKVAAVAALSLDLYMILQAKNHKYLAKGSRVKLITELSICLITPIFCMATNYIVQTSRFVIVRYVGCYGFYSGSVLTIFLVSIWNLLWAVVAVVLVLLTGITYYRRRKDVKDLLHCTNSGLSVRLFTRILVFIALVITILVPMVIYTFVRDAEFYHGPYNWKFTHEYFNYPIQFYAAAPDVTVSIWLNFAICVISFLLFGLGQDAIQMYKSFIPQKVRDHFNSHEIKEQVLQVGYSEQWEGANTGTSYGTTIGNSEILMKDGFYEDQIELESVHSLSNLSKDLESILRDVENDK